MNTCQTPAMDGPLWAYALDTYAKPGIAEACLVLQDRLGVDVSILLFAMYVASRFGLVLDSQSLEVIDASLCSWRTEVLIPLRNLRKHMKGGILHMPVEMTAQVRELVKTAELSAEQTALAKLSEFLKDLSALNGIAGKGEQIPSRIARMYAARLAYPQQASEEKEIKHALNVLQLALVVKA